MFENEYKTIRITSIFNQDRVKNIYTNDAYNQYLLTNDYSSGGIAEVVGNPYRQVKPYFDFDSTEIKFDESYKSSLIQWMKDTYNMDISIMSRADRVINGKNKSSLRTYIQNYRISFHLIPIYFQALFKKYEGVIDTSVYNNGRILHTLGNRRKANIDVPPLVMDNQNENIENCFATYIEESYKNLDESIDIKIRNDSYDKFKLKTEIKQSIGRPLSIEGEELSTTYYKLNKYIKHFTKERATEYDSWIKMCWSIFNIGYANDLTQTQIRRLIHNFSEKADNYDDLKVDNWIDKNLTNIRDKGYGWPYINECLKHDDEKYYNSMALSYYNKKREFELTHIKCMYPPTIITIGNEKIELQTINNSIKTYNHIDCFIKEKNNKGEDVTKKVKFINEWLKDHYIRVVKTMTLKPPPLAVDDNEYNLWTGFKITKIPYTPNENIIKLFLEFGTNLLGEEYMNYSLAVFARRLQTPAKRAYILQLLYSQPEGTGKNTWFKIFREIFGKDKFAQLESADDLFSSHSTEEEGRLFVLVDEAKGIDNYKNADKLKARITSDSIRINPKGIQAYELPNNCDYLQTTNNYNCLPQTDQSRRFAPIEVSNHYVNNVSFFTQFNNNIIDNETSLRCIYEYLMNFNINKIIPSGNFQNHIPNTEFKNALNEDNRNRVDLFIEAIANYEVDITNTSISKSELFQKFINWMNLNKFNNNYNIITFGRKFNNTIKSKRLPIISDNRKYHFNMEELVKLY